jgi:hypothetical protein
LPSSSSYFCVRLLRCLRLSFASQPARHISTALSQDTLDLVTLSSKVDWMPSTIPPSASTPRCFALLSSTSYFRFAFDAFLFPSTSSFSFLIVAIRLPPALSARRFAYHLRLAALRRNCRVGLKKMLCELAYPGCTATPQPVFPCESRCTVLVSQACGTDLIEQVNFRFGLLLDDIQGAQLKNLGFEVGSSSSPSCQAIYDPFRTAYSATSGQCTSLTFISNPTNCRCVSVNPSDFPFCGAYLGSYPVWDYLTANASLFDQEAQFRYDEVRLTLAPGSVHQPCQGTNDFYSAIFLLF